MSSVKPSVLVVVLATILLLTLGKWSVVGVGAQDMTGENGVNITSILNQLQVGYDKRVRPNFGGDPVAVAISMYILDIPRISERDMDLTIECYFRQYWMDPRLAFEKLLDPASPRLARSADAKSPLESIDLVGSDNAKNYWIPDTFIVNEKGGVQGNFATGGFTNELLRIKNDGSVMLSRRLSLTVSCPMSLAYFPMDKQLCALEIESYAYTITDVVLSWKSGTSALGISYSGVSSYEFHVEGYRLKAKNIHLTSGNYSRLAAEIQFARRVGYYVCQVYIPSAMLVIISWVPFWLQRQASAARLAVGITAVLILTVIGVASNFPTSVPKVSYVRTVDTYTGFCFFMIFAAMLEYATVSYLSKKRTSRRGQGKARADIELAETSQNMLEDPEKPHADPVDDADSPPKPPACSKLPGFVRAALDRTHNVDPALVDVYSRILFPLLFVVFNFFYWIINLRAADVTPADLVPVGLY